MAQAKPQKLRFLCGRCRAKLAVPMSLAGKFMECPKCKEKTPIPHDQEEADLDAKDLSVQQMYYQVGEKCIKCNRKMKKGATLCIHCGFDYKEGKQHVTEDWTVQEDEKRRGGPALMFMIFEFLLIFIVMIVMVVRLLETEKVWWEQGIYLSLILLCFFMMPGHFMQWYSYRIIPIRDHPLVKEEDRAERQEAMSPYEGWTPLVFFLAVIIGMGAMFLTFSRDEAGKLVIPFMEQKAPP
jgi:predicted nucleic acid-binding Zn ribbon protein